MLIPLLPMLAAVVSAADPAALFESLRLHDLAALQRLLAAEPALANARNPKGTSAVSVALFASRGEGFIPPAENRALAAILARKPELTPVEKCAVGTAAEVKQLIACDPEFARAEVAFGWTPLHAAAFAGNLETAKLLLAAGAEVNARAGNKFKNSPLQVSLLTSQLEMARLLIARGADVNQKQEHGFTALQEAALAGSEPLLELLLGAGADVAARADDGRTALDEALRGKHPGAAKLLRERGAVIGLAGAGAPE
jgi:uncharacterized protein